MSHDAVIVELKNVRKHSNADRLQIATALGYQVIVGLEVKENDVAVLFIDDLQLSEQYCFNNNLHSNNLLNKVTEITGYFSDTRRIKAQSFRKEKSEAYVATLESLSFTGYDITKLSVGDRFSVLNDIPICNKYYTPATKKTNLTNKEKTSNKTLKEELKKLFPEHRDTEQFRFALDHQLNGMISITYKKHGTSGRVAHILYPEEIEIKNPLKLIWNCFVDEILHGKRCILNFWTNDEKASKLKFYPKVKHEYQVVHGTRRVIKGIVDPKATDYRSLCAMKIAPYIKKGEQFYFEILGYEDSGATIMQSVDTSKMGKEFIKRFGQNMVYKYGCLPATCKLEVYRITQTLPDGSIIDLPWSMIKERCKNSGLNYVPEVIPPFIYSGQMFKNHYETDCTYDDGIARWDIREYIEHLTEDLDIAEPDDPSHIKEGIVVRIDNLDNGSMRLWKSKNLPFRICEGIVKDNPDFCDEEEVQGDIPDDTM